MSGTQKQINVTINGIDCAIPGGPNQIVVLTTVSPVYNWEYVLDNAGAHAKATYTSSTDPTFTLANHGFVNGDVVDVGSYYPNGTTYGGTVGIRAVVNATANTFQLAYVGGSFIPTIPYTGSGAYITSIKKARTVFTGLTTLDGSPAPYKVPAGKKLLIIPNIPSIAGQAIGYSTGAPSVTTRSFTAPSGLVVFADSMFEIYNSAFTYPSGSIIFPSGSYPVIRCSVSGIGTYSLVGVLI